MKRLAKKLVTDLSLDALSAVRWKKDRGDVLLFHRVSPEPDVYLNVPPETFRAIIRMYRDRYNVLPLADFCARLAEKDLPPQSLVITFTDGYEDNFTHAAPILREEGVPASFFLATSFVDQAASYPYSRLKNAVTRHPIPESVLLNGRKILISPRTPRGVLELFKEIPFSEREAFVNLFPDTSTENERFMTWEMARAMRDMGFTFGSHTCHHTTITAETPETMEWEIIESKRVLEENLGVPITHFSYPFGRDVDATPETRAMLQRAGYTHAFTSLGRCSRSDMDPLRLDMTSGELVPESVAPWMLHRWTMSSLTR